MNIFLAIIIGLLINFFYGGTPFNTLICFFAWIFLIMPFLLKFKTKELFEWKWNKKKIWLLIFNIFFINMIIILMVSILFFWLNKIIFWFVLLWILSGWWLLLSWINKTRGNIKLWFQFFIISFIIFNILFIWLDKYIEGKYTKIEINKPPIFLDIWKYTNNVDKIENKWNDEQCVISVVSGWRFSCSTTDWNVSWLMSLFILVLLPFIISRIILFSDNISNKIIPYISKISSIASFILISYIFSLKELNILFNIEIIVFIKYFISLLIMYLLIFIYNYIILKKHNFDPDYISIFWLSVTRFLTLWVVFSFILSWYIWIEIMLIFTIAYFVQIPLSIIFSKIINKKEANIIN